MQGSVRRAARRWIVGLAILVSAVVLTPDLALAQAAASTSGPGVASEPASGPAYILVYGRTTDRAKIGAYAASLPPIYAANGGHYLAVGATGRGVEWLEGPVRDRSLILAQFPNRAAIDGFWWGEAYRSAIRKRDNAGVFSVLAFSGVTPVAGDPAPFSGPGTGYLVVMTATRSDLRSQRDGARANALLVEGAQAHGGRVLANVTSGQFTALEGDTVFDRVTVLAWPTSQARAAFLDSRQARQARTLRQRSTVSLVAQADGVAASAPPPAAVQTRP